MGDTAISNVSLVAATGEDHHILITTGLGTAIATGDTHVITPTGPLEEGVLIVQNTYNGAKYFTIKAGDNPPADAAGQGDLANISVADGDASYAAVMVSDLPSARFLQNNGTLRVDVEAGMTGFMYWYQIPRH